MSDPYDWEEHFHSKDTKESRKERKLKTAQDRSKFKKSDLDQKEKQKKTELPSHFLKGRVLAITTDGILVDCNDKIYTCTLKGVLKKEKIRTKNLIAIGDFVQFEPLSEDTGAIAGVAERRSVLSRADNLLRRKEQLIAVNIDQVIITTSVVLPALKPPLIDRYIIAARKGMMTPLIVINKIDLFDDPPPGLSRDKLRDEKELFELLVVTYRSLGIQVLPISLRTGEGLEELKNALKGKSSVFSGQSGTGKTSLINALTGSSMRIGEMIEKTRKGSHTTSSARLLPLDDGAFCIDTPGIRSFGLWDIKEEELQEYFSEIAALAPKCRFQGCTHLNEPDCAVQRAVKKGLISPLRFDSYCALMNTLKEEHRTR